MRVATKRILLSLGIGTAISILGDLMGVHFLVQLVVAAVLGFYFVPAVVPEEKQ
jgi:hypothetical protein